MERGTFAMAGPNEASAYGLCGTSFVVRLVVERTKQEAAVLAGPPPGDAEAGRSAEITREIRRLAAGLNLGLNETDRLRYRFAEPPTIESVQTAGPRPGHPGPPAAARTSLTAVLRVAKTVAPHADTAVHALGTLPAAVVAGSSRARLAVDTARNIVAVRARRRALLEAADEDGADMTDALAHLEEAEGQLARLFTGGVVVERWVGEFRLTPSAHQVLGGRFSSDLLVLPRDGGARISWISDAVVTPPPDSWVETVGGVLSAYRLGRRLTTFTMDVATGRGDALDAPLDVHGAGPGPVLGDARVEQDRTVLGRQQVWVSTPGPVDSAGLSALPNLAG